MKAISPEDREAAATEAVSWLIRLTSGDVSPQELRRFERWRNAAPEHESALADARQLWLDLGEGFAAMEVDTAIMAAPSPPPAAQRQRPRRRLPALAAAAVLIISLGLGLKWQADWRHQYSTGDGEQRALVLADGSKAWLNPETAMDFELLDARRLVRLAHGEVFFDVVHDSDHPFIVDGGIGEVRVLGTAFAVRRERDDLLITVQRGRVRVSNNQSGHVDIQPNQQVRIRAGSAELRVESVNAVQALAWHDGRLFFEDAPLPDIVQALKRYDRRLVLSGLTNDRLRLSTMIDLQHLDDWYQTLEQTMPVRVTRFGPVLWISESPAP